jgi:hypothetical protein
MTCLNSIASRKVRRLQEVTKSNTFRDTHEICHFVASPSRLYVLLTESRAKNTQFCNLYDTLFTQNNIFFYMYTISWTEIPSESRQQQRSIAIMFAEIKMRPTPSHDSTNNNYRLTTCLCFESRQPAEVLTCNKDTEFSMLLQSLTMSKGNLKGVCKSLQGAA